MSDVLELPEWVETSTESQIAKQLRWSLRPLQAILDDGETTDVHVNGAGPDGETLVFIKRLGKRERRMVRLTERQLENIGFNAAVLGRGQLTERMPFSPGQFPDGQRVQLARYPAVPEGRFALSIRRAGTKSPTPDQLEQFGVFERTEASEVARPRIGTEELLALKAGSKWRQFLETAFRYGYSGVFAGPVNSGKTTNLRALFHAIPRGRRMLTVQDTEELYDMPQEDVVHFLYPKETGGVAQHTAQGCIEAALRMDMDEIICGEIRDGAAWALMRAGSSGHAFKTSCHAPSAEGAFSSILRMAKENPVARSFDSADLMQTLRELIDFVAFSEVVDDQRRITQVWFDPTSKKGMPKSVGMALKG